MAEPSQAAGEAPCGGLGRFVRDFDLLLCDVFGTIHDADGVFPDAIDALARFRASGGTVMLVSNSAMPGAMLAHALAARGVGSEAYDAVVSSADVTRALMAERGTRQILHLGSERERVLFDGVDVDLVEAEAAELIVCTGYPASDVVPLLTFAKAQGVDLICTNPDRQVVAGGTLLRFAGLVAQAYAEIGGRVIMTGKPDASIYDFALARAVTVAGRSFAANRTIGVGDTLALDVAGALDRGFAAIHIGAADDEILASSVQYRLPVLAW